MNAVELRDRDLPVLEPGVLQLLAEGPDEKRARQCLLIREVRRVDRLETVQELLRLREVLLDLLLREVGQLVVPALVAEDGRELGAVRERVLPLLREQVVHRLAAGLEVHWGRRRERQAGRHEKG